MHPINLILVRAPRHLREWPFRKAGAAEVYVDAPAWVVKLDFVHAA
jgi:hypothetical protein